MGNKNWASNEIYTTMELSGADGLIVEVPPAAAQAEADHIEPKSDYRTRNV